MNTSSPKELPFVAINQVHEGVTTGGCIMRAQRVGNQLGAAKNDAEIECLRRELAAFNKRIEELEKQHPEASKIEALRASALVVARQIDEIRCSSANDLSDLLAK